MHGVVKEYTVRYRVSGRKDSVSKDFFLHGNMALGRGVGNYDVRKENIYIFHFDPQRTAAYCHGERETNPLGEWCPGMWHQLCDKYNLLDGFANAQHLQHIPQNATCLITMCHPETLPLQYFKSRPDLKKILYTAEGPNIRHQEQWSKSFLQTHFDIILTFWNPLLEDDAIKTVYCPHNARFLEFPRHTPYLRENTGKGDKSIALVLERRTSNDIYTIDSNTLQSLDSLRELFVEGLKNITVYGDGWKEFCEAHEDVTLGYSIQRHLDEDHTPIDHYATRDFALILENCDAEGYVSEKIGDAFIAGSIPLYYGNPTELTCLPTDSYIDIRQFKNGYELQLYLDNLSDQDIDALKKRVLEMRCEFLHARGRLAIARATEAAMALH